MTALIPSRTRVTWASPNWSCRHATPPLPPTVQASAQARMHAVRKPRCARGKQVAPHVGKYCPCNVHAGIYSCENHDSGSCSGFGAVPVGEPSPHPRYSHTAHLAQRVHDTLCQC